MYKGVGRNCQCCQIQSTQKSLIALTVTSSTCRKFDRTWKSIPSSCLGTLLSSPHSYYHSLKLRVLCRLQIRLLYIVTVTVSLCYGVTVHYHMFQKLVQCAFPLKPHKFFKCTNTKNHLGGLACKDNPPLLKFLSIDIIPPFWNNGKRLITLILSDS